MASLKIFSPTEYVEALTRDITQAKQRVVLFSHIIGYDDSTRTLIDALCFAAERGVTVEVAGDVFTYGIMGGWKGTPFRPGKRVRALRAMVKKLRKSGVEYQWIGQLGPFLFAGRTHIKWCVVDDKVYAFGGVNLYEQGMRTADYMLGGEDAMLADQIVEEHERIIRVNRQGRAYASHEFASAFGNVLIDGGRLFDSIIYKRACELAQKASDITFVSQYCPTGRLGKIMKQRGAKLYFSRWKSARGLNRFLIRTSMFSTGYKTLYRRRTFIHAKCIIFAMPSGKKVALTGTHNFVRGGVVLGTREIALESSDPQIITELEAFLHEYIY